MKHKYLTFVLTVLMSMVCSVDLSAFEKYGFYYGITSPYTVEVTGSEYTGSVTIPESVTYAGKTYSVTSIGGNAFYGCSGLTSVTIPSSVTSIDFQAFYECSGLTSVTIPNSVASIGSWAFSGCTGLTSVTIGNSVTSIGQMAFSGCSGLTKAEFASIESLCSIIYGDGDANPLSYAHHLYIDGTEVTDIVIPNSVTSIGNDTFKGCSGLISVTIPNSVTSIGGHAFKGCSGLISVTIPNSVTSIGSGAFSGCSGLTSVTIPNSVTSIGRHTFYNCSGLTSVTIPNSVASIGSYAFCGCSGLTSVTIPNSVTSIGSCAFWDCYSLTKAEFASIESLCGIRFESSFSNHVPDGGSNPLSYAHHLYIDGTEVTDIVIPNSVTSIGASAFNGCSGLTSVTIPNSVTSIGGGAFSGCSGLTSVTIPNSVTSIDWYTFSGCHGLTSVTIGNGVTSIGSLAFSYCRGLTSVTIPNSVTSIGDEVFSYCTGLTSVTIPNSVTNIGTSAFEGCLRLERITCHATIPPTCGDNVFYKVSRKECTLEVPHGSLEDYLAASPWNEFENIEELDSHASIILVYMRVTLSAEYGTYCSSYSLDFTNMEGLRAYVVSAFDAETGQLKLTRVMTVEAGTGLILRGTPGVTYEIPEAKGVTFEKPEDKEYSAVKNLLVGVTEDTELEPIDGEFTNFILAKDAVKGIGFYRVASRSTLKTGKAYLPLPSDELSSEVKGFRMMFDDGDMSDNVETIHNEQFTIHNEAGAVYDLQGRRVPKPTKGIYIVNGKKTVIR